MTIKAFLDEFQNRLNSIEDENEISLWVEFTLLDHLEAFSSERPEIADRMNEHLLDICTITAPGERWPEFREQAEKELKQLQEMY